MVRSTWINRKVERFHHQHQHHHPLWYLIWIHITLSMSILNNTCKRTQFFPTTISIKENPSLPALGIFCSFFFVRLELIVSLNSHFVEDTSPENLHKPKSMPFNPNRSPIRMMKRQNMIYYRLLPQLTCAYWLIDFFFLCFGRIHNDKIEKWMF